MEKYGPHAFNGKIATIWDLRSIARCVTELPDASTVSPGCIFHYIGTQENRPVGHFFRCVEDDEGRKMWVDITVNSGTITVIGNSGSIEVTDGGYACVRWEGMFDTSIGIEWERDLVVRKLGEFPVSPDDGEVIFANNEENRYAGEEYGVFYEDPALREYEFKYRVFHIANNGTWCYTDLVRVEE